jgi:hypothetical protein
MHCLTAEDATAWGAVILDKDGMPENESVAQIESAPKAAFSTPVASKPRPTQIDPAPSGLY